VGARLCNIHVRAWSSASARLALLFRDHLRAQPQRTAWWSELKIAAAGSTSDPGSYGRIKYPAWCLLMELAEVWARDTGWAPPHYLTGSVPA
jgi:dephospho-CoA kinase